MERPEREYDRTRLAFVAAVRRLSVAMNRWIALEVPLYAQTGQPLPGWTAEQNQATEEAAAAWQNLVRARRAYRSALGALRRGTGR